MSIRNNANDLEFESDQFQQILKEASSLFDEIDSVKPWKPLSSLNSLKKTSLWLDEWIINFRDHFYNQNKK